MPGLTLNACAIFASSPSAPSTATDASTVCGPGATSAWTSARRVAGSRTVSDATRTSRKPSFRNCCSSLARPSDIARGSYDVPGAIPRSAGDRTTLLAPPSVTRPTCHDPPSWIATRTTDSPSRTSGAGTLTSADSRPSCPIEALDRRSTSTGSSQAAAGPTHLGRLEDSLCRQRSRCLRSAGVRHRHRTRIDLDAQASCSPPAAGDRRP